ncbi:MAG: DPP IV N-terminal domain-containing protein [Blastocatellales bacterium]
MSKQIRQLYEFSPFLLDAGERLLMREGKVVPLPPKVFDTLLALVENSGRILGKDELMQLLWPDTFVEESNLTQNISQLRRALANGIADEQYIETIPKRGYRFAASVRPAQRNGGVSSVEESVPMAGLENGGNGHALAPALNPDAAVNGISPAASVAEVEAKPAIRRSGLLKWAFLACGLALAALLLFIVYYLPNNHARQAFRHLAPERLTAGNALYAALSRDGKYVAYVAAEGNRQSLWVRQVAAASGMQVVAPAEVIFSGVTFSPDANFIYYVVRPRGEMVNKLFQIPLLGGTPREVMKDVDSPITFSPDGQQFAFVRNHPSQREVSLNVARLDGSAERKLITRKRPETLSTLGPSWSPDGRLIACAAGAAGQGESSMRVLAVRVEDGSALPIGSHSWTHVGQVAWLGDGSGVVVSAWQRTSGVYGDQLYMLTYPRGEMRRVTNDMTSYEGVSVTADSGALVARRTDRVSRIWIAPTGGFDASQSTQIQSGFGDNYSERFGLDWTPDGQLVYAAHASGNLDVWLTTADGKRQKQLTRDAMTDMMAVVTPDGRHIVFASERSGGSHIWRMDIDGGNPKQLTRGRGDAFPSLSPDGRWVVYSSSNSGGPGLWKVSIDGGEPVQLSQKLASRPVVSPDGKWIACFYQNEKDGRSRVALFPFAGGEPVVVEDMPTPDLSLIRWSPDGRALTYIATRDGVSNIWSKPLDSGEPRQLTSFTSDQIFRFAWSRDGKRLACERGMIINDAVLIRGRDAE